jgi:hypothetical protein
MFRPALGPTQPPIQWVTVALSLAIKWPGREADRSPPSSAEVKGCVELYLHSPNTSWHGAYLSTGTTLPFKGDGCKKVLETEIYNFNIRVTY